MISWFKKRLEVKIFVYFMVAIAIFAGLMTYHTYKVAALRKDSEVALYKVHGKTLIKNFSGSIIFGLLSLDKETMKSQVQSLFEDPTISYVIIYNESKEVVFQRFGQGWDPGEFAFEAPSKIAGEEDVGIGAIESKTGERFLEFQREVKASQEAVVPGEESPAIGWVCIGMSLKTLNSEIRRSWIQGFAILAALLVFGLVFIALSLRAIMPPIQRLVEAARRMGEGDFDVQVPVTSQDQIGMLTETFNHMAVSIKDHTSRAEHMIANISDAIQLLTDTASHLMSVTTQQSSGATEQASVVEEVVTTTEEISATADRIADTANSVSESAQQTSEAANKGNEFMHGSIHMMESVREQVEKATEQIMELANQAQMIGGIIDIIEEISEQTNLLALNAAIEAAGAGEAGSRFSVVANEVRRLANRTLEATESVRGMVDSIQKSTNNMVMLSENQQKAVTQGAQSVRSMGEHFHNILEMVEATRRSGAEIGLITKQQSTATQQMVTSIREVEEVAKDVEKGVREIETSMAELGALAERLKSLVAEREAMEKEADQEYREAAS